MGQEKLEFGQCANSGKEVKGVRMYIAILVLSSWSSADQLR